MYAVEKHLQIESGGGGGFCGVFNVTFTNTTHREAWTLQDPGRTLSYTLKRRRSNFTQQGLAMLVGCYRFHAPQTCTCRATATTQAHHAYVRLAVAVIVACDRFLPGPFSLKSTRAQETRQTPV